MSESQIDQQIVIISGATACGKSQLALDFGEKKDIVIINCDSLQIYQGLPILSAQPSQEEQKLIPHYLYSHLKPQQNSSVGLWLELIKDLIPQILAEGKIPVIVGGSGMYISKLIEGISKMPEISPQNRAKSLELYQEMGHQKFQEQFGENKLIDKQRLLRACEVYLQTQKPISFWQEKPLIKLFPKAKFLHVNLEIPREKLYQNCNLRFEKMLKLGALQEVEDFLSSSLRAQRGNPAKYSKLLCLSNNEFSLSSLRGAKRRGNPPKDSGLPRCARNDEEGALLRNDEGDDELLESFAEIKNWPIAKTLGFAEIALFLQKKISNEEMLTISTQKTRNYAKRQLTFFRNQFNNKFSFASSKEALDFLINQT